MQNDNYDYEESFKLIVGRLGRLENLVDEMAYLWKCQGAVFENDLLSQDE